jgi:DNA-binding transcriptional MerR regulator
LISSNKGLGGNVKISELSKRTNTSKETIHNYIREGLLRKPHKVKQNMANYSEGHVETLLAIRDLRENYYMPLPEIKKYLMRAKKKSLDDFPGTEIKEIMDKFFKQVERLFPSKIIGKKALSSMAGLTEENLSQLEEWQVMAPEIMDGQPVYPIEDVIIARTIKEVERLGFLPEKDNGLMGMKRLIDFIRDELLSTQEEVLALKYPQKKRLTAEQLAEASMVGDLLSLYIVYVFRKLDNRGFRKFLDSINDDASGE